jgi:hypothetical protein
MRVVVSTYTLGCKKEALDYGSSLAHLDTYFVE